MIPIPVRMAPLDEGREGRFFCLDKSADLFGEGVMALQGQRGDCLAQQRVEIAEPAHRRELEEEFRQLLITALASRFWNVAETTQGRWSGGVSPSSQQAQTCSAAR